MFLRKLYITPILLLLPSAALAKTYTTWAGEYWPAATIVEEKGPFGDPDRDGEINLREYAAGTSPFDHGSALAVTHPSGTSQFSFVEAKYSSAFHHPSAYLYLRVTKSTGTYAIPISGATRTDVTPPVGQPVRQQTTVLNLPGAVSCQVVATPAEVTLREVDNLRLEYQTGGNVLLRWEDRSVAETGFTVERRSYTSAGALASALQIADVMGADITSYTDTTAPALAAGYYSYTVTPYRPHPSLPAPYRESGTPSDSAMMYYTSTASARDMDLDFIPDLSETMYMSPQDPFDSMLPAKGSEIWPSGTTTRIVRPAPIAGEASYTSITLALASTSVTNLIIYIYPGTYTGTITIPSTRNIFIYGMPSLTGPNNKVILQSPNTGSNLLVNNGGGLFRNIIFKGVANSTKSMVWLNGNDVFTRSAFENCIFTGHTNAAYPPVLIYYGRNRFTHCTFVGNSTVSDGSYIMPQAVSCSYTGPRNIVENSIIRNSGSLSTVTPETSGSVWYRNNFIREESYPEGAYTYCISDNPQLVSNNHTQVGSVAYSTDIYSRSLASINGTSFPHPLWPEDPYHNFPLVGDDIDGQVRDMLRPDAGADEFNDQNLDNLDDILTGDPDTDPSNTNPFKTLTSSWDADSFGTGGPYGANPDGNLNGDELIQRWNRASWTSTSPFFNRGLYTPEDLHGINLVGLPFAYAPRPAQGGSSMIINFNDLTTHVGELRIYGTPKVNANYYPILRPIAVLRGYTSSPNTVNTPLSPSALRLGPNRTFNDWTNFKLIWVVNRNFNYAN